MRWFEKQRLEWISDRKEPFNRSDLVEVFGISIPQASKDISKFIKLYPGKIVYNHKKHQYEPINITTQRRTAEDGGLSND